MTRYTGPARFVFAGDPELCKQFMPEARKYLGGLSATNSVETKMRRITNSDGVVFTVQTIKGQPRIKIDVRKYLQNVGDYKTVVYYFDYNENVFRGIHVDTGNEEVNIVGLTGIGAMTVRPDDDKIMFSHVTTSAGLFYNVILDLSKLALYARNNTPPINTPQRPNKRARQPGAFAVSPDGKRGAIHYQVVTQADGTTVYDGYGGYYAYSLARSTDLEDPWPLFESPTNELTGNSYFIERGWPRNGGQVLGLAITRDDELILPANNDSGGNANILSIPAITRHNRIYRYGVSGAPTEMGYVTYSTGDPPGGFWVGGSCLKMLVNNRRVYALFDRASISEQSVWPYTHENVEILALPDNPDDPGLTRLRGEIVDQSLPGAPDPLGACVNMAMSASGQRLYVARGDKNVAVVDAKDTLVDSTKTVAIGYEGSGTLTQLGLQYFDTGPSNLDPASKDPRLFMSVLDGAENRLLICRPRRLDDAENGDTISPYRYVILPGLPVDKQYNIALRRVKRGFL